VWWFMGLGVSVLGVVVSGFLRWGGGGVPSRGKISADGVVGTRGAIVLVLIAEGERNGPVAVVVWLGIGGTGGPAMASSRLMTSECF